MIKNVKRGVQMQYCQYTTQIDVATLLSVVQTYLFPLYKVN